jgi:hypothetical protein
VCRRFRGPTFSASLFGDKRKRLFNTKKSSLVLLTHLRFRLLAASLSASANARSGDRSIRVVRRFIRVDGGAEGCEKELITESVVDLKTLQLVLHGIFELGKT